MVSVSNTFEAGGGAVMQLLESKTIQGAEHDSSARYPPPKCHPETRQTLRGKISIWIVSPRRNWRMFYVLGPAGVGKSAVAQTVADDCKEVGCLGASCFISRPNHRNDPDGIIPTLAYQLAVKHEVYKRIISHKLAHDPTILRKSRRVQFKELLVDPFHIIMTEDASAIQKPLLIVIDGLDECASQGAQCEFIELIGNHVRSFPEFPLLWLICSRPESHLKYALSQADFQVTCRREEISVDDDESQDDVLIYLRNEFENIRRQYQNSLDDDWPPEDQLLQIARAASGLFAFASTITRFVCDANAGDPSDQLQVFITILEGSKIPDGENPYLTLDLLYRHILASVPPKVLPTTMRIIGLSIFYPPQVGFKSARIQANFLRIRKAAFDHALKQLHSVLRIGSSKSSDIFDDPIDFYHASFGDFLRDLRRSGEYCIDEASVHYDVAQTALSWHMDLGDETQKADMWTSPSEDTQTRLAKNKALSLIVLWRACSRVQKENARRLYQELQKFDFNVLRHSILDTREFGEFLSWVNLQAQDSSIPNLLNSLQVYEDCSETSFIEAMAEETSLPGWAPAGFVIRDSSSMPKKLHLNLGYGARSRHIHIVVQASEYLYLTIDVFYRHLLAIIPPEILPTTMRIIGMSILFPPQSGYQSARKQANFLRIGKTAFHRALKQLSRIFRRDSASDIFEEPIDFYPSPFRDFFLEPERSGEHHLDKAAIYYDVALTALNWLMDSGHEVQQDDIWISSSEDLQTCVENIKSLSLAVLWKACSRVRGENAVDLYTKLQQLDFNVLDRDIQLEWRFGDFLGWLNRLELDTSASKLLNSLATYKDCHETGFTEAVVHKANLPSFTPEEFVPFDPLKKIHLNLGHGRRCRHIHIVVQTSRL